MSGEAAVTKARGHEGTQGPVTHFVMLDTNIMDAAHRENSRYCIRGAVFMPSQSEHLPDWAIATDGRILACAPARVDGAGFTGVVDRAAALDHKLVNIEVDARQTRSWVGIPERYSVNPLCEGTFPPANEVVPDPADVKAWMIVDVDQLVRLANAIISHGNCGRRSVAIGIAAMNKPLLVLPFEASGFGVMMPVQWPDVNTDSNVLTERATKERARFRADWDAAKAVGNG